LGVNFARDAPRLETSDHGAFSQKIFTKMRNACKIRRSYFQQSTLDFTKSFVDENFRRKKEAAHFRQTGAQPEKIDKKEI
jgi:hypothetical protein